MLQKHQELLGRSQHSDREDVHTHEMVIKQWNDQIVYALKLDTEKL